MNEKVKKFLWFCCGFFSMMIITAAGVLAVMLFLNFSIGALVFGSIAGLIALAVIGIVLWATNKKKRFSLALGFLIGGLAPGIYMFVMTGGCGLLGRF